MAVVGNDFELGSNGANVSTSSIASSGFGYRVLGSATAKFTTDSANGSLGVSVARASNNWYLDQTGSLSTNDLSFSLFVRYKTALPNSQDWIADIRTAASGGSSIARMLMTASTGIPFFQVLGTTVWTGGTALVVNTWYRLDIRIHINASSGSVHADFYTITGSSPLFSGVSFSGSTGSNVINDWRPGPSATNSVTVGTFEMDYPRHDATQSSSYLGPLVATQSSTVALTQASTLAASGANVRSSSVAFTQQSILTVGSAIWDDFRHTWDDIAISWDDNTLISSVAFTQASTLSVSAASGAPNPIAFTNDSILSAVAYAYSGDLALLVGVADFEWAVGDSDVEWTSASNPST